MKFLFLEPFYGGSHRDFADGLIRHSRYHIDLYTLPDRFWKWRMRGAALHFHHKDINLHDYDGLIVSDLMSLSDYKALSGPACPPALVYYHENQLTYPLAPGETRDFQFGFTDITTALTADTLIFNSHTHRRAFLSAVPGFIKMMPDFRPKWVTDVIAGKIRMLYPGCHFPGGPVDLVPWDSSPPLIIWNHRWEFDKNPEAFFSALDKMVRRGLKFRLAVLGESSQKVPKAFIAARKRFQKQIVQYGYAASRTEYRRWLEQGAITISTAKQENFGISIVEAVRHGCLPLLPDRLSYPEILPEIFHTDFLYRNQQDLLDKLAFLLANYAKFSSQRKMLSEMAGRFAWETMIDAYDKELEKLGGLKIQ